jgi:prevent-host-death family protein
MFCNYITQNTENEAIMASVTTSELQRNFGRWHDEAAKEPLQITKHGRETAYLVSAETFNRLWTCYRRAVRTTDLSDAEMQMIREADIAPQNAYEIDDPVHDRKPKRQPAER